MTDVPTLSDRQAREIVRNAVAGGEYDGKSILLIVPDLTRTAPVGLVYKTLYEVLERRVKRLDCIVALGTHQPLSLEQICKRLEITPEEYSAVYSRKTALYNHDWDNPGSLKLIGVIPRGEIGNITRGAFDCDVPVYLNRKIFEYDHVMIAGSVFPHELAGFSGGNKYFFPGVSAGSMIDTFHWLGALVTNRKINGCARNPVRSLIDRAAAFVGVPTTYFNIVMDGDGLAGIFPGRDSSAWLEATGLAERVNIVYTGRQYARVVCVASGKYDDFWTAAKAVYKAEAVVADGGELIVVAPHIRRFSHTHEEIIRRAGYHPAEWFRRNMDQYAGVPGTVLAHLALACCEGEFTRDGKFRHRITVTLATGIDKASCLAANLGYRDWQTIDLSREKARDDAFVVENAGDILYKPTWKEAEGTEEETACLSTPKI